jgi:hypothetical protein
LYMVVKPPCWVIWRFFGLHLHLALDTWALFCLCFLLHEMKLTPTRLLQLEWGDYWPFLLDVSLEGWPILWLSLPVASGKATEAQVADFV